MSVLEIVERTRAVAVVRGAPAVPDPAGLAEAVTEAGISLIEFTPTMPDGLDAIDQARQTGAITGTVLEPEQARAVIEAGARFIVSPEVAPELIEAAGEAPVFLAGFSPTEVVAAHRAGAAAVKLFPARLGEASYIPGSPRPVSGGPNSFLLRHRLLQRPRAPAGRRARRFRGFPRPLARPGGGRGPEEIARRVGRRFPQPLA